MRYACPYLNAEVELTDERAQHIAGRHPDFLPAHKDKIPHVLGEPDQVRRSKRLANALLFTRWFTNVRGGKFIVIVVVADNGSKGRNWIVTGYIARKIQEGEVVWKRS